MRDIYSHHKFMTFKQLREYYAMLRRRQKIWFSLPFFFAVAGILFTSISMGASLTAQLFDGPMTGILANNTIDMATWVCIMLCVPFLPVEHTERFVAAPVLMGAFTLIPFVLFGSVSVVAVIMVCYYTVAAVLMKPIAEQVLFMKQLPDFPFLERVELERMEYERTLLYSEKANQTLAKDKMPQKPHEEYDGSQAEELLSQLPERHLEDFHIKHGEFDTPEDEYTDKLSGSDGEAEREMPEFDDPDDGYEEAVHNFDAENERYRDLDEAEEGFKDAVHKYDGNEVKVDIAEPEKKWRSY